MLTSSEKRDSILRMIAQLRQMAEGLSGKLRGGEDPTELLADPRASLDALLGPIAGVVQRLDSASAAQMVNDPDVLAAWAEVTAAEADAHRAAGDSAAAAALARRALELAVEAHRRSSSDIPELPPLIARLRTQVDAHAPPPGPIG
ncbi:MAG: hypothetical protein KY467_02705 [Gemmatimonadetes bacterium]|nr:hypothetical protein [Gemmatimonadota bacterium]